jgi:hypothetical protein
MNQSAGASVETPMRPIGTSPRYSINERNAIIMGINDTRLLKGSILVPQPIVFAGLLPLE